MSPFETQTATSLYEPFNVTQLFLLLFEPAQGEFSPISQNPYFPDTLQKTFFSKCIVEKHPFLSRLRNYRAWNHYFDI